MTVPIRPENRDRYPANWPEISYAIRLRAGWCCEQCGVRNGTLGGRDSRGEFRKAWPLGQTGVGYEWPKEGDVSMCDGRMMLRIVRIVLTVAHHLDHQPENCEPANLRAWCQRCHNLYDVEHRRAGIFERAREGNVVKDLFA